MFSWVYSSTPSSLYKYREYFVANLECSVSNPDNLIYVGVIIDITQPCGSSCSFRAEKMMPSRDRKAIAVVRRVSSEHDHGLCIRGFSSPRASSRLFRGLDNMPFSSE